MRRLQSPKTRPVAVVLNAARFSYQRTAWVVSTWMATHATATDALLLQGFLLPDGFPFQSHMTKMVR